MWLFVLIDSQKNKMQSVTADFVPGAATWRTGRKVRVIFDSGPFAPLCEKYKTTAKQNKW